MYCASHLLSWFGRVAVPATTVIVFSLTCRCLYSRFEFKELTSHDLFIVEVRHNYHSDVTFKGRQKSVHDSNRNQLITPALCHFSSSSFLVFPFLSTAACQPPQFLFISNDPLPISACSFLIPFVHLSGGLPLGRVVGALQFMIF